MVSEVSAMVVERLHFQTLGWGHVEYLSSRRGLLQHRRRPLSPPALPPLFPRLLLPAVPSVTAACSTATAYRIAAAASSTSAAAASCRAARRLPHRRRRLLHCCWPLPPGLLLPVAPPAAASHTAVHRLQDYPRRLQHQHRRRLQECSRHLPHSRSPRAASRTAVCRRLLDCRRRL